MLRKLSLFSLIGVLCASGFAQQVVSHSVKITSSRFTIHGQTNVSAFTCELYQPSVADTLDINRTWFNRIISFDRLNLKYPVKAFNCELELMNQDLQELLQSDKYPWLLLRINSIHIKEGVQEIEKLKVKSVVTLTIAGVTKDLLITNGTVVNQSEKDLTFIGSTLLNLDDFNIEPPSKFFGMVKVNQTLEVSFSITIHVENLN